MPDTTHSVQVGAIQCVPVNDGTFSYPANWFFSNVPQERLEEELRAHELPSDHVLSPYTCLLIKTGEYKLLVDTGAADLAPTTGQLLQQLQSLGVGAADIDTVVLTHGHPDHIAGAVDREGRPAFPNARYVMWKDEWDFWTAGTIDLSAMQLPDEIKELLVASARKSLPPLKNRIELLERETELAPGVHAVAAPGHTPGHMAVLVSSGPQQLLHISDAVLHPLHMEHPEWRTVFDFAQEAAAETRRRLLDRAAADRALVLATHFPFPSLGHVVSRGPSGWRWEAM